MCLIVAKAKGIELPPDWHLKNGAYKNSDGIGIAYWKPNTDIVHIKKDFKDIDVFLPWLHTNINKEDSIIIHFRFATSGYKDEGNRHPFPLTQNKKLLREVELVCKQAVAHNGVLSQYSSHKKYSDTQKFIADILSDPAIKNNLNSPTIRKLIEDYVNRDRVSIIEKDGRIYLLGTWEEEKDVYYSNGGFKYGRYTANKTYDNKNYLNSYYDEDDFRKKALTYKTNTEGVWISMCDGCFQRNHIKNIEYNGNYYKLCKKCRKKLKKGLLTTLIVEERQETESVIICDNCLIAKKESDIEIKGDFKICKTCISIYDFADLF